jgi:hypothetical protein
MKNAVLWDVAPCRPCVNLRFGGTYRLHLQCRRIRKQGTGVSSSLQPPAHSDSSLADFSTLKMKAIRSSETSVHTSSTRRHIPEDCFLHSHRRENLKSYKLWSVRLFTRDLKKETSPNTTKNHSEKVPQHTVLRSAPTAATSDDELVENGHDPFRQPLS